MHATAMLSNFRHQRVGENLRNYIDSYFILVMDSTRKDQTQEYDLQEKLDFLRKLRNKSITSKIMRSREFRNYD